MGNKALGCSLEPNIALSECSAQANTVLSTDLMYESGVSMEKKGSDSSITMPQTTTTK